MSQNLPALCVGCERTSRYKHGLKLERGTLCPSCIRTVNEKRPPRRPAHELEECLACLKNIDVCCGEWFYGDTEDGLKVHKRCEKAWAKVVAEINAPQCHECGYPIMEAAVEGFHPACHPGAAG